MSSSAKQHPFDTVSKGEPSRSTGAGAVAPDIPTRDRLDRLARGVAHDLKNQLTAILGNLSLVIPTLPSDSPQLPILREVELSAQRSVALADQLQVFAGQIGIDPTPTDLGMLAKEMVRLLRGALPVGTELDLRLIDTPASTMVDTAKIREALMHLIVNAAMALKEHPERGIVTLSIGRAPAELGPLALDCRKSGFSGVFLEVADNGCGMGEMTRQLAFDPYFSTRTGAKGLGMAYVAGIVRSHGGAIALRSEPGKGTSVRLYLPALDTDSRIA